MHPLLSDSYYTVRPFLPRQLQILLRSWHARVKRRSTASGWPDCQTAAPAPPFWPGWPRGKRFALVLTHDVETEAGVAQCERLARLEEDRGLRSAFGFVPRRYRTPDRLRLDLAARGFEIVVHGLYHDGKDFRDRATFERRRGPINAALRDWGARGFSSASMLHDPRWLAELDIEYSLSSYDADPFEPQQCQAGRLFPYWVESPGAGRAGFLEMPYTLPQDFTLFVLLKEPSNALWLRKLDSIARHGGMALVKAHPDFMSFGGSRHNRYPASFYSGFLDAVQERYGTEVWYAKPAEVAEFWRGLASPAGPSRLAPNTALCARCQSANAAGWLNDYAPAGGEKAMAASRGHQVA